MTAKQQKKRATRTAKAAKPKATWSETMKKALKDKQSGGKGPAQPKPRDSGTFKVKKNAF